MVSFSWRPVPSLCGYGAIFGFIRSVFSRPFFLIPEWRCKLFHLLWVHLDFDKVVVLLSRWLDVSAVRANCQVIRWNWIVLGAIFVALGIGWLIIVGNERHFSRSSSTPKSLLIQESAHHRSRGSPTLKSLLNDSIRIDQRLVLPVIVNALVRVLRSVWSNKWTGTSSSGSQNKAGLIWVVRRIIDVYAILQSSLSVHRHRIKRFWIENYVHIVHILPLLRWQLRNLIMDSLRIDLWFYIHDKRIRNLCFRSRMKWATNRLG